MIVVSLHRHKEWMGEWRGVIYRTMNIKRKKRDIGTIEVGDALNEIGEDILRVS